MFVSYKWLQEYVDLSGYFRMQSWLKKLQKAGLKLKVLRFLTKG